MNWQALSSHSPYQAATTIAQHLQQGNVQEAQTGIEELIDALARSEKRALKSQLTRLMLHIIKWKSQPQYRSRSWQVSILNAREEILDIQDEVPSLNRAVVESLWQKCFNAAKRGAEAEMNQKSNVTELSWQAVFEDDYSTD